MTKDSIKVRVGAVALALALAGSSAALNQANEKEQMKKFDILYDASFVVKVAYKALDKSKKDYVVPGKYAKLIRLMAKFTSHKFMMKLMDKMFKYEKQN